MSKQKKKKEPNFDQVNYLGIGIKRVRTLLFFMFVLLASDSAEEKTEKKMPEGWLTLGFGSCQREGTEVTRKS